jgi:hypothetical protein
VSSSTFRCGLFGGRGLKSFVGARNASFIKLASWRGSGSQGVELVDLNSTLCSWDIISSGVVNCSIIPLSFFISFLHFAGELSFNSLTLVS